MKIGPVGSVARLWRFPVKSMAGERLSQVALQGRGLLGDRAYALIDAASGKVVSAKSVRQFPDILRCRASFVEPPRAEQDAPPVCITLPDGTTATSESGDADRALSEHFGRRVTLARAAPDDFTIDEYHPDVEGADPAGRKDTIVEQKLGAALFAELGLPSPVPAGAFFDVFPVSLLTTSTIDHLNGLQPASAFDERRFRMNVIVQAEVAGFIENDWVGHTLGVGGAVRVHVAMPGPRCVMTTLAQDDLGRDTNVLRALVEHNRLQVGDLGRLPCAGVYAAVAAGGLLRVGDSVALL